MRGPLAPLGAGIDLERSIDFDSITIPQWAVRRADRSVDPEDEWPLAQAGKFVQQARAFDGRLCRKPRLRYRQRHDPLPVGQRINNLDPRRALAHGYDAAP